MADPRSESPRAVCHDGANPAAASQRFPSGMTLVMPRDVNVAPPLARPNASVGDSVQRDIGARYSSETNVRS